MLHQALTEQIIGASIEVHRALGPGLLESAYEACLVYELTHRGLALQRQQLLPLEYRGLRIDAGYRVDLIVENAILIELKSVDRLLPLHEAQVLTYLRLSGLPVGLLLNFNELRLLDGLRRFVGPPQPAGPPPAPGA